jgi:hypothetical protein
MKIKFILKQILYYFMIVFGIFFGFGSTLGYFKGKNTLQEWILGLIIVGLLPAFFGIILLIKLKKEQKIFDKDQIENTLFQLAKKNNSKLTTADIAMNTTLSTIEAKKIMDELCLKGIAEIMVSESGVIVYHFKTIINDSEKQSAEKI